MTRRSGRRPEASIRALDLSSWESILATVIGIALFALIGVGVRLLVMLTVQQRRERMNRQINERLKTLIAAYKSIGGSFTGDLSVDPTHLRDLRRRGEVEMGEAGALELGFPGEEGSDRTRRIRDSVEAALSDIILLGTEEQVRLAAGAARELVAGRPVHTHDLVVSLRNFIREALDLDLIRSDVAIPAQGPTRPASSGGRGRGDAGRDGSRQGGARGSAGSAGGGGGMGMGAGLGVGLGAAGEDGR